MHLPHKIISFSLLLTCIFITSCQQTPSDLSYQAIGAYTKKAEKKWDWELNGLGGQFGDTIQRFNLDYSVTKEVDVAEARRTLINGVEEFLYDINHNDKIIPLLAEFPFSTKSMKFGVTFTKPTGEQVDGENIVYALMLNGRIGYCKNSPLCFIDVHEESYEEALEIVRNERARTVTEITSSSIREPSEQASIPRINQ